MIAHYQKYELQFKQAAGTSRGVYNTRPVWFLFLNQNNQTGIGECAPLPGLSQETPEEVETALNLICQDPMPFLENPELLQAIPSVRFGLETALTDLQNEGRQELFPSAFTKGEAGIPINGLIWMGPAEDMRKQIQYKLESGYRCIKLKIGALHFEEELELLHAIRTHYPASQITLRVDANGAFKPEEALEKLNRLAALNLHSIEQPLPASQWTAMQQLCQQTPVPIALDEELIGINTLADKERLLDIIRPQYLVLKPSLHGGFSGCSEWISLANERSIGWWITSYLESNIGLNAIAQWTFTLQANGHQGLGTGQLFTNNVKSPLEIRGEELWFNPQQPFELSPISKQANSPKNKAEQ